MSADHPSLAEFEGLVAAHRHEAATNEAVLILLAVERGFGELGGLDLGSDVTGAADPLRRFATRFAGALGELLCQPDLTMSGWTIEALFVFHRWIDMLFALSDFGSSTPFQSRLATIEGGRRQVSAAALTPYLILASPSANLEIDLDACFAVNPGLTIAAVLGYLSNRFCLSPAAGAWRERLLDWAPGRIDALQLGSLRLGYIAEVYMTCSYASGAGKHRIKADLIAQLRRACHAAGCREASAPPPKRARPRIVVVVEHMHVGHSVFRTHYRALRSLRRRFEVIGVVSPALVDQTVLNCFDEVIAYPGGDLFDQVKAAAYQILAKSPDMVFHLGVGMHNQAIALASLILAPVQCASFGHAATTMSPAIDYWVAPDDFFGDEACFSEALLRLPPEAMPYVSPGALEPPPPRASFDPATPVLRIAVAASALKLNAAFLGALAEISARASRPVAFDFLPLGAVGLAHDFLSQEIGRVLPNAVVHAQAPRQDYLARLGACGFFLSPFPYGNMNSIVDAAIMGLPGVCLDGAELHAHTDVALFRRLGLPAALSTSSLEDYVAAAVRLIDDPAWLAECRGVVGDIDLERRFYGGKERLFCDALYDLVMKRR